MEGDERHERLRGSRENGIAGLEGGSVVEGRYCCTALPCLGLVVTEVN